MFNLYIVAKQKKMTNKLNVQKHAYVYNALYEVTKRYLESKEEMFPS